MDKRSNINTATMITTMVVLVILFAGQAHASFKSCMEHCLLGCLFGKHKIKCGFKCLAECIINGGSCSHEHNNCKLGCAMDKCSHSLASVATDSLGREEKIEEMDSCVNRCGVEECAFFPGEACPPS